MRLQIPRREVLRQMRVDSQGASAAMSLSSFCSSGLPCTRNSVGTSRALELARHRHVGHDHALLDQPVGLVALAQLHRPHVLAGIDDEFGFRGVKVERTTPARAL